MSVLIKGMDMPKEGAVTITVDTDGVVIRDLYEEHNYEAVEVPTPHGVLVDRLAVLEEWCDLPDVSPIAIDKFDAELKAAKQIINVLFDAPAIIEAED